MDLYHPLPINSKIPRFNLPAIGQAQGANQHFDNVLRLDSQVPPGKGAQQ